LEGSVIVHIWTNYSAPLLAAGAAVVAIAAAPSLLAAPNEQSCADMGGSTVCQRAGNVQIHTSPHATPAQPGTAYGPFEGYDAGRG
jgi:hypothetical protein